MRHVLIAVLTVTAAAAALRVPANPPPRFNYQARLTDSFGAPLHGSHTLHVGIYQGGDASTANSGTKLYEETAVVSVTDGVANHAVGTGAPQTSMPLSATMLQSPGDMYLQVAVDTETNVVLPRSRIDSVPFALVAANGQVRTALSQPASLPLVIDKPGSYYLASNIVGEPGSNGIEVTTAAVTLDLNGFALLGVEGSLNGVYASFFGSAVTITNGTIQGWGESGIDVNLAPRSRVSKVAALDNGRWGIRVGDHGRVEECVATGNNRKGSAGGIYAISHSLVTGCQASRNVPGETGGTAGIRVYRYCVVTDNICVGNSADQTAGNAWGIHTNNYCRIENNLCTHNYGAYNNTRNGYGIDAGTHCRIIGNTCTFNVGRVGYGIRAGDDCRVVGNACSNNGSAGLFGFGIAVNNRCVILENQCNANTGAPSGSAVGITARAHCRIENNHCANQTTNGGNSGYGIRVEALSEEVNGTSMIKNTTSGNETNGIRIVLGSGANYLGENIMDEGNINDLPAQVEGTGDRSNIVY